MKNQDFICKDENGNIFLSLNRIDEDQLKKQQQLTHCLAVVKSEDDYLLGWNRWRKRYEIFGGCIEKNETPRECIMRELYEELGVISDSYEYLGAMKFYMMPDYFSKEKRIEIGGLYGITLNGISIDDIDCSVKDKDEIVKLAWYSQVRGKEPVAIIDEKLLEYF